MVGAGGGGRAHSKVGVQLQRAQRLCRSVSSSTGGLRVRRRGLKMAKQMRSALPRVIFSFTVGACGLGTLILLSDFDALVAQLLPLLFFIVLSLIVKRAGVYSAPDTLHSLVGIVDLAAVFIFAPLPGAWVPTLSSLFYVLFNNLERGRQSPLELFESSVFYSGLRGLIGLASGAIYVALGGTLPPHALGLGNLLPAAAAMLFWFIVDNLGCGLWETLRLGRHGFYRLFRETLSASLLVELVPLPFSIVIAVVYTEFGGLARPIFLLLAAALIEGAFVIQRYAEAQERLEKRTRELVAFNEFNQALAHAGFDSRRILELLLEYSGRVVEAEAFCIEMLNASQDCGELRVEAYGERRAWHSEPFPLTPALVFLRDHPSSLLARDLRVERLPFAVEARWDGYTARAAIFVPLLAGEEMLGMLTALHSRARRLSVPNQRSLNVLASQAAIALQNARLYALERRRAQQLALVSQVGRRIAQFLDLDQLVHHVVHEIRDRFGYAHVHLLVQNENRELLFYASTHPLGQEWRKRGERLRQEEGIIGWVAANAEPLLVTDVTRDPRYVVGPDQALINTRSELAVPLIVGERVLGVLDVQSERVGAFGEEDLYILKTLAAQLAIAIEDARLFAVQKAEAYYTRVLLNIAENLAEKETLDEALDTIVRLTTWLLGVTRSAVFLYDPNEEVFRAAKAYGLTPEQQRVFDRLRFPRLAEPPTAFTEMWRTQKPVLIEHAHRSELVEVNLANLFDLEAIMLVPLVARKELVGALGVDTGARTGGTMSGLNTRLSSNGFSEHEVEVLKGIADQAAVAIERARLGEQAEFKKRMDYELGLARQIQISFLPHQPPQLPGYEIASEWRAAREVSGDFYDFIPLHNGRLGLVIADVSDKGLPASLFMALTRTIIRTMAFGKPTPREALERANDVILADARADMFVTAFYGVLHPESGALDYTNAGHNPPLLYRYADKSVTVLTAHGIALGIYPNAEEPQEQIALQPGDMLVLYTDGITDALNQSEKEFGMERLAALIAAHGALSAQALLQQILRAVEEFSAGVPQFDDLTMVVLKRDTRDDARVCPISHPL